MSDELGEDPANQGEHKPLKIRASESGGNLGKPTPATEMALTWLGQRVAMASVKEEHRHRVDYSGVNPHIAPVV